MNYQLMFQTIAFLMGGATLTMFLVTLAVYEGKGNGKLYARWTSLLFIITLVTGALAAGLS